MNWNGATVSRRIIGKQNPHFIRCVNAQSNELINMCCGDVKPSWESIPRPTRRPVQRKKTATTSQCKSEHAEQVEVVNWLHKNHPGVRIFAIPNGGLRNKFEASRIKLEGVSPGVPDLMIPSLKLFIEMKRVKGGVVSPEQAEWMEYLRGCGYTAEVARGCDEAIKIIQKKLL